MINKHTQLSKEPGPVQEDVVDGADGDRQAGDLVGVLAGLVELKNALLDLGGGAGCHAGQVGMLGERASRVTRLGGVDRCACTDDVSGITR
jgi:hypothetical protein